MDDRLHTSDKNLSLWRDGQTKSAILEFVEKATSDGSKWYVPRRDRIAVFDNDGTLWCEKPMPIELGFILQRLRAMAESDVSLRQTQPWRAAHEKDYRWLGDTITKHYRGDDSDVKVLVSGILRAFDGWCVDKYEKEAETFLRNGKHPTLGRSFRECRYAPMLQLLNYLEANDFMTFIASAGDRDFMRPITEEMYGIPPERIIGSCNALRYRESDGGGEVVYVARPDVFDDGPTKPVRIWNRIGRRPLFAAGNSNGDIPMLEFSRGSSGFSFRLLLFHDDKEREFSYVNGAERSLDIAKEHNWTVVSMEKDWTRIF